MRNCSRALRFMTSLVCLPGAFLGPCVSSVSQPAETAANQQDLEAVERALHAARLELLKLRADADYIESAISEEMHLREVLKPADDTKEDDNLKASKSIGNVPGPDTTVKTDSIPTTPTASNQSPPVSNNPTVATTQPQIQPQAEPSPKQTTEEAVVQRRVNIRAAPSLKSRILGAADGGTRLALISRSAGWVEIRRGDSSAWIDERFIFPSSTALARLAVTPGDDTKEGDKLKASKSMGNDPGPDTLVPTESIPTSARGTNQLPPAANTSPREQPQSSLKQTTEEAVVQRRVNIRAAPSLKSRIVGAADSGTRLAVISRTDGWVEVQRGDSTAWIDERFIATTSNVRDRQAQRPQPPAPPGSIAPMHPSQSHDFFFGGGR